MVADEADPVLFLIEDNQSLMEEKIAKDQGFVDGGWQEVHAQHADPIVEAAKHVGRWSDVEG